MFGGKKRHAAAVAQARAAFDAEHGGGRKRRLACLRGSLTRCSSEMRSSSSVSTLWGSARDYDRECEAREAEAARANGQLDALITGLQRGENAAVQEYVGIVLGNSVYPEILSVEHDYEFDSETRELSLTVLICPPDRLPVGEVLPLGQG